MNIVRTLLAISFVINLTVIAYIAYMDRKTIAYSSEDQGLSNPEGCLRSRRSDIEDHFQNHSKELENRAAFLEKESTRCKQSLKEIETQLAFQKLNEQEYEENLIAIDQNMPDDLQETIAIYSNYLTEEVVDDEWSQEVTTALETIIDREKYRELTIVTPINCRSTLCNYELIAINSQQADQIEALLTASLTDTLGSQTKIYKHTEQDSGSVRVIMYYARAGHALPPLY